MTVETAEPSVLMYLSYPARYLTSLLIDVNSCTGSVVPLPPIQPTSAYVSTTEYVYTGNLVVLRHYLAIFKGAQSRDIARHQSGSLTGTCPGLTLPDNAMVFHSTGTHQSRVDCLIGLTITKIPNFSLSLRLAARYLCR